MATSHTNASRRLALSYSVEGLPARDELLLKSLVRVLDHRSRQQWHCVDGDGDLRVTGAPFGCSAADGQEGAVLRMGYPPGEGEYALPMPLHAGHLEQMFNSIGDAIELQRAQAAAAVAQRPVRNDEAFRLRRWPPASVVSTPERRSLAALMSVRAQSLASLHRLSNVPVPMCTDFLRDLRQADLVITTQLVLAANAGDSVLPAEDSGSAAFGTTPAQLDVRAPAPATNTATQVGLFARIRARFGLQPAWSR